MSFTAFDILLEFAEASRYGRTNHTDRYARWADRRWWNEIGFQTLRPKYEPYQPVGIRVERCPKCLRPIEYREGNQHPIHLGFGGAGCLKREPLT